MSNNLTGQKVSLTYGRIVQVVGGSYFDGLGNPLDLGMSGLVGATGTQGPLGPQGTMGPQGWQGIQGLQGTQGLQGAIGLIGPTGSQGWQGFQGPIGMTGPQGWQGHQGPSSDYQLTGVTASSQSLTFSPNTHEYFGISHSAGPSYLTLPNAPYDGKVVVIKDESGAASASPITVAAQRIDTGTMSVIQLDHGSITLIWRGSGWWII